MSTLAAMEPQADSITTISTDETETPAPETLVEELLVEEISIDGMCGVY
jgi:mycofactocin precursor